MTLTIEDIASLALASGKRTRIADPAVRALVTHTVTARKAQALADAEIAAQSIRDYTPEQKQAITTLTSVHWPRARAVRDAMRSADASSRIAFRDHDADSVYAHVYRAHRLSVLAALIGRVSARTACFPVSMTDMDTAHSRFTRAAYKRHFTFSGGRDIGSKSIEPAEIVQGAFIRAIENGDTVNGVPTFGSMYRHVQAERAHLTRVANAEYAGMRAAAFGNTNRDEAYPDMTDTHNVRLLGTRKYATLSQHRESLAVAHRDTELALIDDAVTNAARIEALDYRADESEFHVIVARVIMAGASLEDISGALGLTVQTIKDTAIKSSLDSLRNVASGIDHSQRSADIVRMDEREAEIDAAQAEHAAHMRGIHVAAETVHYAISKTAEVTMTPTVEDDYMERGQRVIVSMTRDNARVESNIWHPGITERQHFTPDGWKYSPDVIRTHAFYMTAGA